MIDLLGPVKTSTEICFYSDASASEKLGYGCIFNTKWIRGNWNTSFILENKPSIEYLELFALTAGILTWGPDMRDCRIMIFCDNTAVMGMINKLSSKCKNCMILLKTLTLNGLTYNRRIYAKYVSTKENFLADSLSQGQMSRFRKLGPHMNTTPDVIHHELWPMTKVWVH